MDPETKTPPTTTDRPGGRPARVRLDKQQVGLYASMLRNERYELTAMRADAKSLGRLARVTNLNRRIEAIDRMQQELIRAAEERGWVV